MAKRLRSSWIDIVSKLFGMAIFVTLVGFLLLGIRGGLNPHPDIVGKWEIMERNGGLFGGCNIIGFSGDTVSFTDVAKHYAWVDANHIKVGEPSAQGPVYEVGTPLSGGGIILKDSQGGTIRLQKASSDPKYDSSCSP